MSKEEWIRSYEICAEDIADEKNIEIEEAEKILDEKLEKDRSFLDGYLADFLNSMMTTITNHK